MLNINQWWETLSSAQQIFWFIAVIFTVLFLIQFVFVLIGFDSDSPDSAEVSDFEHEFSALSIRSIIAFFTFFGWTGVLALHNGASVWIAAVLASVAGIAAMFIVAYMVYKFAQLEQSGTLNLYNALDKPGEVYLTIPANEQGVGKVHLLVEGRVREIDAVTSGETLITGTAVKVIDILNGNVLKVEVMDVADALGPSDNNIDIGHFKD